MRDILRREFQPAGLELSNDGMASIIGVLRGPTDLCRETFLRIYLRGPKAPPMSVWAASCRFDSTSGAPDTTGAKVSVIHPSDNLQIALIGSSGLWAGVIRTRIVPLHVVGTF
jgi:hypothetical protein